MFLLDARDDGTNELFEKGTVELYRRTRLTIGSHFLAQGDFQIQVKRQPRLDDFVGEFFLVFCSVGVMINRHAVANLRFATPQQYVIALQGALGRLIALFLAALPSAEEVIEIRFALFVWLFFHFRLQVSAEHPDQRSGGNERRSPRRAFASGSFAEFLQPGGRVGRKRLHNRLAQHVHVAALRFPAADNHRRLQR